MLRGYAARHTRMPLAWLACMALAACEATAPAPVPEPEPEPAEAEPIAAPEVESIAAEPVDLAELLTSESCEREGNRLCAVEALARFIESPPFRQLPANADSEPTGADGKRPPLSNRQAVTDRLWRLTGGFLPAEVAALSQQQDWAHLWRLRQAMSSSRSAHEQAERLDAWMSRRPRHPFAETPPESLANLQTDAAQPRRVGLFVPLSGSLAAAGRAVRDGFVAAYLDDIAPLKPPLRIYDTAADSIGGIHERSLADGVDLIVGPLSKQRLEALRQLAPDVSVLGLNYLEPASLQSEGGATPDRVPDSGASPRARSLDSGTFLQLGLAIEDEAATIAEHLLDKLMPSANGTLSGSPAGLSPAGSGPSRSSTERSSARGGPSGSPAEGSLHARGIPSRSPAEGSFHARGAPSRSPAEGSLHARGAPSRSPAEGSLHARGAPSRSPAEGSFHARGAPSRSPAEGSQLLAIHGGEEWAVRGVRALTDAWPHPVELQAFADIRTITESVGAAMGVAASTERKDALERLLNRELEFMPRARSDLDGVVAFVDHVEATALAPALAYHLAGRVPPIYASSQSVRNASGLAELGSFHVTEMPFNLYANPLWDAVKTAFGGGGGNIAALRALGMDAYRVVSHWNWVVQGEPLYGATGKLQLDANGQVRRRLAWASIRGGRLRPTAARAAP